MKRARFPGMIAAAVSLMLLLPIAPAEAQFFRTWVSSGGSDSNACSRTQPCRTFNGAQAKTNAGGEINCLGSGDYPTIFISKPITIDCSGALAALGAGLDQALISVNVNEASFPKAIVRLRNLALNHGDADPPAVLIRGGGAEIHLENFTIVGAGQAAIIFHPDASLDLFVRDTFIGGSGTTAIGMQTISARGRTSLNHVRLDRNASGVSVNKAGTANAFMILEDVQIEGSTDTAITAIGNGAFVFLSSSTVALNDTAFKTFSTGKIFSLGNNTVVGNGSIGSALTPRQLQ